MKFFKKLFNIKNMKILQHTLVLLDLSSHNRLLQSNISINLQNTYSFLIEKKIADAVTESMEYPCRYYIDMSRFVLLQDRNLDAVEPSTFIIQNVMQQMLDKSDEVDKKKIRNNTSRIGLNIECEISSLSDEMKRKIFTNELFTNNVNDLSFRVAKNLGKDCYLNINLYKNVSNGKYALSINIDNEVTKNNTVDNIITSKYLEMKDVKSILNLFDE